MNDAASQPHFRFIHLALKATTLTAALLAPGPALAQSASVAAEATSPAPAATGPAPTKYHLGAHAELDLGTLIALKQGAAFAGGVVWGPFRAGMSYATFLSNKSFGGTPDGFTMRANYIVGFNASYFVGKSTDEGFYVQPQLHIKQQGVTNNATGDHKDLNSVAVGLELGYVWKIYKGMYVAPRIGALYYAKKPQGSGNHPVPIGDRAYDNSRHHDFDTYLIPTLSLGYSW